MKKIHYYLFVLSVLSLSFYSCIDDNEPITDFFKDQRDGQIYNTVQIGEQTWMAENLKYLPNVVGPDIGSESIPFYYVYGYSGTNVTDAKATSNFKTYGVLYNWPAAMNGDSSSTLIPSGVKGVCPNGWHLPSKEEWNQLIDFVGGSVEAGKKLKEAGTTHWYSESFDVSNESGFTALPGGFRGENGTTNNLESDGIWWSTTESSPDFASSAFMTHNMNDVYSLNFDKELGFSVRCVRD